MKKQKVFFQNEPCWLVESSFIAAAVFGAQIFVVVFFLVDALKGFPTLAATGLGFISFLSFLFFLPFIAYSEVLSRFSWNVHLDDSRIWMRGDWIMAKKWRIQKPVEVFYDEIVSISVTNTTKNSSGQSIIAWTYGPIWSKKRYLVFRTITNQKKNIHVSHFTDAALAEMIDEIVARVEAAGNASYDGRHAADILFESPNSSNGEH